MDLQAMTNLQYLLGMAGHTDHGKSALVQALTGIDPDRLPEEKARGMTLDLGFAHMVLPSKEDSNISMQLDIVDVPGHASFINNMVSGVGAIDAALFIVAVDDLWMPQSEEHLQIIEYLGVTHGVFALTKVDLVDDCHEQVADLREWLNGSALQDAPIVPTSVVNGRGLEELKQALAEMLSMIPPQADTGKPRLAVDRTFTRQGIGTVVTGTLTGGSFQVGQQVAVQPKNLPSRIRTLQTHSTATEKVLPGARVALGLSDIELAGKGCPGVARGDVVTFAGQEESTKTISVWLTRSGRETLQSKALKHAAELYFHQGTDHQAARVYLLDRERLNAGDSCIAQIRFSHARPLFIGDRFLLRDWAKQSTVAGGIVVETHAEQRHYRSKQQIALLKRKHAALDCLAELLLLELEKCHAIQRDELLKQSKFSSSEIQCTLTDLLENEDVLAIGTYVVDRPWWEDLLAQAKAMIDAEHQMKPQLAGISISTLRSNFAAKLPIHGLVENLLDYLETQGFTRVGNAIGRTTHKLALSEDLRTAVERIRGLLQENPVSPPPRKELAADSRSREAIAYLIAQGEVVAICETLVMSSAGYEQAKETIGQYLQKNEEASLAQIRDLLSSSRRVVVPLIEKLDREGFTVRRGDLRSLK